MKDQDTPIIVDFDDVPVNYTPCFTDQCPRSGECARYAVGQAVPPGPRIGSSVYPKSFQEGKPCPYFYPLRIIREAWGFDPLFAEVKARDEHKLRLAVEHYLGSHTTYFRYNHGERTLTPEQQEDILQIFAWQGYDPAELHFAHYRETVDYHAD